MQKKWGELIFLWAVLVALTFFCLTLCGCTSVVDRPEQLRALRREIGQCDDDLNNSVQILSYCARMTPDSNLANRALDGVLKIIGEPSPEEKVYAASLDIPGCDAVLASATDSRAYRAKLLARESSAEIALSRDYHAYARRAGIFSTVKFLSFSAIGLFALFAILRHFL